MNWTRLTISGPATEAIKALEVFRAVFPEAGTYGIERLVAKAEPPVKLTEPFETWFLQRLEEVTRERFQSAAAAIWQVLEELLRARGVAGPSRWDLWTLRQTLFDLTTASTARMVGLEIPTELRDRLRHIGFAMPEVLDFPGVAYRMGLLYEQLQRRSPVPWDTLVELAGARPLSTAEQAAVTFARTKAGLNLQPIFDDIGRVWTAERELRPLRDLTARALERRIGPQEAARELKQLERMQGVFRDAERVMRTEMAEARAQGVWAVRSVHWQAETKIFRLTQAYPCRDCLRLYKLPTGMPRLYTHAEIEAAATLGYNRSPRSSWHPTIGPTHPHCVCAPWQEWHRAMEALFRPQAAKWAALGEEIGAFEEVAA